MTEVSREDQLLQEIGAILDHPSLYMGGASRQSLMKARAILPIIERTRIEGVKAVLEAAKSDLRMVCLTNVEDASYDWLDAMRTAIDRIAALDPAAIAAIGWMGHQSKPIDQLVICTPSADQPLEGMYSGWEAEAKPVGDGLVDLIARLRRKVHRGQYTHGGATIDATGKGTMWGNEKIMELVNPDGPAAADALEALGGVVDSDEATVERVARVIDPFNWRNYDRSLQPFAENRGAHSSIDDCVTYEMMWRDGCRSVPDAKQWWLTTDGPVQPRVESWRASLTTARAAIAAMKEPT